MKDLFLKLYIWIISKLSFTLNFNKGKDLSTYEQVKLFHETFNVKMPSKPTPLSKEDALIRASFLAEEVIELLHASSNNHEELRDLYQKLLDKMDISLAREIEKTDKGDKQYPQDDFERLVAQFDSLLDQDVFVNGTYTLMGINPKEPMRHVFNANMSKLFPDGKPRFRETDGKIMKPDGWIGPEMHIEGELINQILDAEDKEGNK